MSNSSVVSVRHWDVIVIGTGMGAATAGYALAKTGKRVLFCEKGKSSLGQTGALRGAYAEQFFARCEAPSSKYRDVLSRAGRYHSEIEDRSSGHSTKFIPFIGSTTGGSTALYGMALERFFPCDFSPRQNYPDAPFNALPQRWPVSYDEFLPYYQMAERLYRVRGGADELRHDVKPQYGLPPSEVSPRGQELFDFLQRKSLHPYRLPQACEFVAGCEGCQGYLCAKDCKNDGARICLEPALGEFGAELLDECTVVKLVATRHEVTAVECVQRGQAMTLRADIVVLGAGALATPKLLLDSASPQWPNGLANDSGMVGRNLMRHYVDLYAVFTNSRQRTTGNPKEIAFNDFYLSDGKKFGSVQSFGVLPPTPLVVASMEQDLHDGGMRWAVGPFNLIKPGLIPLMNWVLSRTTILATIMEDLPYPDNQLTVHRHPQNGHGTQISFTYTIRDYDKARLKAFRATVGAALKPYRFMRINQAENNQRIAHVCGTCRFGLDPEESVLDANNKAHSLSNLYIVDASFFPSSGGTNPALTIAANALRVAAHLCGAAVNQRQATA
jgi:choline dehydrogenase-like flavoprotein